MVVSFKSWSEKKIISLVCLATCIHLQFIRAEVRKSRCCSKLTAGTCKIVNPCLRLPGAGNVWQQFVFEFACCQSHYPTYRWFVLICKAPDHMRQTGANDDYGMSCSSALQTILKLAACDSQNVSISVRSTMATPVGRTLPAPPVLSLEMLQEMSW